MGINYKTSYFLRKRRQGNYCLLIPLNSKFILNKPTLDAKPILGCNILLITATDEHEGELLVSNLQRD